MKTRDKPMPIASLPDNWSTFNGHEVMPWEMSRAEAAATLRRARSLRARGKATVRIEGGGRYRPSTFNLQHPNLEYEAALTACQAPTSRRPGRCETLSGRLPLKTRVT